MKSKIEPVRPFAVFTTIPNIKNQIPEQIKKEFIKILITEIANYT